jgi:hypothetical protein
MRRGRKLLYVGSITGCLTLLSAMGLALKGEEIYSGEIHGGNVTYSERLNNFSFNSFGNDLEKNVLVFRKGNIACTLEDVSGEVPLDLKDPNIPFSTVEFVTIRANGKEHKYVRNAVDGLSQVEQEHAQRIFGQSDTFYHTMLGEIHVRLNERQRIERASLERSFETILYDEN